MRYWLLISIGMFVGLAVSARGEMKSDNDFIPADGRLQELFRRWDTVVSGDSGERRSASQHPTSQSHLPSAGAGSHGAGSQQKPPARKPSPQTPWETLFQRWDAVVSGTASVEGNAARLQETSPLPKAPLHLPDDKLPDDKGRPNERENLNSLAPFSSLAPFPPPATLSKNAEAVEGLENPPILDRFMKALASVESDGHYSARNPDSGALGKYQILPSNWKAWCREYTQSVGQKPRVLPQTPEDQETIAEFKLRQYYRQYRSWQDVASVWYCGKPLAQVEAEGWADVPQGKYPSVRAYVRRVMGQFQRKTSLQKP